MEASLRFWAALGGVAVQNGQLQLIQLPGTFVMLRQSQQTTGGTEGSTVERVVLRVRTSEMPQLVQKLEQAIGSKVASAVLTSPEGVTIELRGSASQEQIAAFAQRTCYHIGQTLTCSQLHGGKAVLLGDAAAAFPPIGQGVNAAMESAMALDLCIGEAGHSPAELLEAARLYNTKWKPEADAVSWMSVRSLFESRIHMLRATITSKLGVSIFDQAKSADIAYSEVRRKAERLWPLWV